MQPGVPEIPVSPPDPAHRASVGVPVSLQPLIPDCYEGDSSPTRKLDFFAVAAAGAPWGGVMIKASQGTYYHGKEWFDDHWMMALQAGIRNHRLGWVRGAYHGFDARQPGKLQADYFVECVGPAFADRDFFVVDTERSMQPGAVLGAQLEDGVHEFVDRVAQNTGKVCLLYGGEWLHELGVTSHMGCKGVIMPRYTPQLPAYAYRSIGWVYPTGWQYCGTDGRGNTTSGLAGYPTTVPGCGALDITVIVDPRGLDALVIEP